MMNKRILFITLLLVSTIFFRSSAFIEGFYKDAFDDEGTSIGGLDIQIDCEYIDYTFEHLDTRSDISKQAEIMIKNSNDDNGYLLYPDGEPRFAIIYYHGGNMKHSSELGQEGRDIIRQHYYNGGSQFGSCAGSYMLSSSSDTYFKIWPGRMNGPNVSNTPIDKLIQPGSPLIGYCDFKAGDIIPDVRHNNGSSVDTTKMYQGTIVVDMHCSGELDGNANAWAWKDNDTTGMVLGVTGHPEGVDKPDQIRLMAAYMLYLTDGLGRPDIKHTLEKDQEIEMNKATVDNDPAYTKIGDKQYHHFLLDCEFAQDIKITVSGEEGFDFHVFAVKDTFAFKQVAEYSDTSSGNSKTLSIPKIESGKWHIGVKLATTVTSNQDDASSRDLFIEYSGKLEVLNGIGYTITATWDETNIIVKNQNLLQSQFTLKYSDNKLNISVGEIPVKSLSIYNMQGRLCWKLNTLSGTDRRYQWQPQNTGMYIIHLVSGKDILTKRISIVK